MPWPVVSKVLTACKGIPHVLKLKRISENIYVDEFNNQYGLIPMTFLDEVPYDMWVYCLVKGMTLYLWAV